ncbi:zinc finger, partial [Paramuricea clavata]
FSTWRFVCSTMWTCDVCDRTFGNKGALGNHVKWKHAQARLPERTNGGEFVCPDCDNAFGSLGGLYVHRRARHPDVYHAARQPAARAIKCLRNKNPRYKEVLAALEVEEVDGELPTVTPSEQPHTSAQADGLWRDQLQQAINIEHLDVDDLDWVADGCATEDIRKKLDELFASWVGHLVRGERAPARSHQPTTGAANPNRELDPQRRRRAQYSAIDSGRD